MVKVKLIRHSERLDYSHPFYWLFCIGHYWADSPLTSKGYQIARAKGAEMVKDDFKPKYIYTSPYSRTMATAIEIKNAFPHSEIKIEPLLAEYQPHYKHRITLYPNGLPTEYDGAKTDFNFPETYDNFSRRVEFIVGKLLEKNTDDFIVMTHGEVLKNYINKLQEMYPNIVLDPGTTPYLTVLTFDYDPETKTIIEDSVNIS